MNTGKFAEDKKNLDYVNATAWKYMSYVPVDRQGMVAVEDLISAGYEGLVKAAANYKSGKGTKFITYAHNWIKGEIIRELIFYIGKDALYLDDDELCNKLSTGLSVEELAVTGLDVSSIPEKEQVRIINKELEKLGLTKDERSVFIAVNGVGCDKVTNLKALARQLGKRESEIRRIKQHAEEKVRKSTS